MLPKIIIRISSHEKTQIPILHKLRVLKMQAQQINTPLKYVKYCMYVQQFTLGVPPPQDNTMLYVSIVFDCCNVKAYCL